MLLLFVAIAIYVSVNSTSIANSTQGGRLLSIFNNHSAVENDFSLENLENRPTGIVEESFDISMDFGLCVRMTTKKSKEYYNMLVPSMKYFWFLPADLTVVLDDTPQDRKFGTVWCKVSLP